MFGICKSSLPEADRMYAARAHYVGAGARTSKLEKRINRMTFSNGGCVTRRLSRSDFVNIDFFLSSIEFNKRSPPIYCQIFVT